jgi:phosphoribosylanthranilate isomerase
MVRVKICGITGLKGALAAVEAGADAVGFVLAPSRRRIDPEQLRQIALRLPPLVSKVGVFVDAGRQEVEDLAGYCRLDVLQFHGSESPEYCQGWHLPVIKAFRVKDRSSLERISAYRVSAYLLDTFVPGVMGGSGIAFNWELAADARQFGPLILAGGLTPKNVAEAIETVRPYAVDISSGVETDGEKDPAKISSLLSAVSRANAISLDQSQAV